MKSIFTFITRQRWLCLLIALCAWTVQAQDMRRLTDQAPDPRTLFPWGDKVFFQAASFELEPGSGLYDYETWISNGTTSSTRRLLPGWIQNLVLDNMTISDDFLYFGGNWYEPDFTSHKILARSDGTTEGTQLVYMEDVVTLPAPFVPRHISEPGDLVSLGNTAFFAMRASMTGSVNLSMSELWKSNGTPAGTVRIKDINPSSIEDVVSSLFVAGDNVYFMANDGVHGTELWKTDGTEAGTVLVKDLAPGAASAAIGDFINVEGTLYFTLFESSARSLWKTGGTDATTQKVKEGVTLPGERSVLGSIGSTLYFIGTNGTARGLWKSDGTPEGTVSILNTNDNPANFARLGSDRFVFTVSTPEVGEELWTSDGTAAGTHLLADLNPGTDDSVFPSGYPADGVPLKSAGNVVYFQLSNPLTSVVELWKTDGTTAGTALVYADGNVETFVVAGYNLYASIADFDSGIKYIHTLYFGPDRLGQTIDFPAINKKAVGQADFDPKATTSSDLPVTYTTSDAAVAIVVDGKIHIVGEGTCTITASQDGSQTFGPATPVEQTLQVYPEGTNLSVIALSGDLDFGNVIIGLSAERTLTISNTGSTDLTITGITFPEGYSGSESEGVLAPGESVEITVTFTATTGEKRGEITVASDAFEGDNTIEVVAQGVVITGVEQDLETATVIYPNPGKGEYTLKVTGRPQQTAMVIDPTGRQRQTVSLVPVSDNSYRFDISHLPAGVYMLKVQLKEAAIVKRIIKTN